MLSEIGYEVWSSPFAGQQFTWAPRGIVPGAGQSAGLAAVKSEQHGLMTG